ncbi:MAG TPA: class I SAM-dependent methyltransferase [Bacteroidia bacterium]|jgi:SAM-dependent methyltransferase|nr:class I SAM-dependent methyltransferase [Bacteroidia bacterium]
MEFKDYFSAQSATYAKSRPHYPDELFQYLVSLCPVTGLAWDCATGNGQAAVSLAKYFKKVIATDGSEQQIKNAVPNEKVHYSITLADNSGIETGTADLVTIAAALHWMDFDKFYAEVNRVLKPEGIFAAWTYYDCHIDDVIDKIVYRLSREILFDYWPAESAYVRAGYKDIPFPFKTVEAPLFKTSVNADIDFLFGYLRSWSSSQRYIQATGNDPVELVKKELETAWGDQNKTRILEWPIALKIGRKEEL